MRTLRALGGAGATLICMTTHSMAMGSGPHPNVHFGIPLNPPDISSGAKWITAVVISVLLAATVGGAIWREILPRHK